MLIPVAVLKYESKKLTPNMKYDSSSISFEGQDWCISSKNGDKYNITSSAISDIIWETMSGASEASEIAFFFLKKIS